MLVRMLYSPNYIMHLVVVHIARDGGKPSVKLLMWRAGGVVNGKCPNEFSLQTSLWSQSDSKAGAAHDALHPPAMLKNTIIKPIGLVKMHELVIVGESFVYLREGLGEVE